MNIVQSFIFDDLGKRVGMFSQEHALQGGDRFETLGAYTAKCDKIQQVTEVEKSMTGIFLKLPGGTFLGSIRRINASRNLYIVDVYGR